MECCDPPDPEPIDWISFGFKAGFWLLFAFLVWHFFANR
jgi:hypothetical protein